MTTVSLGYHPREWQRQCHLRMARFTVLALHRRAGKTELALMHLIDKALQCKLELPMFFYVAPFLKQAKVIAWARLKQRLLPLALAGRVALEINESELSVRFAHNGAIIRIFGGDNPDAMRGVRLDGVVIDEVAQIKPEVWNEIVQPALSDRKGWALFIGTPSGVNLFSELFYKAKTLKDWHSALYTVYDTEAIDPEEVERLKRDMSETSFSREYLCDFTAAGADQLISIAEVNDAMLRSYKAEDIAYAPRILGVDPARFGDDRSVIVKRQGLQVFPPLEFRGLNNMELASRVADVINTWMPDAVFIDAGQGSGVIDRLRQLNHDVVEVPFGSTKCIKPLTYHNRRTEMWFGIADWIRAGGALPNNASLRQDLAAPIYWHDPANKKMLEPKDDIKARGLPSPDIGDALALTFAEPVEKKAVSVIPGVHTSTKKDYNPFDNLQR